MGGGQQAKGAGGWAQEGGRRRVGAESGRTRVWANEGVGERGCGRTRVGGAATEDEGGSTPAACEAGARQRPARREHASGLRGGSTPAACEAAQRTLEQEKDVVLH